MKTFLNTMSSVPDKDMKNQGYIFENIIYQKLKSLEIFEEIHYEKELIKRYGWLCSSIDYLLIHKDVYIVTQLKWVKTKRRETRGINNFIKSVEHLSKMFNHKKMIFGLWISRRKPFQDNEENLKNKNIYCIVESESMDKAAENVASFIQRVMN